MFMNTIDRLTDYLVARFKAKEATLLWLLFLICAFTRLFYLGDKPLMHDESLFAYYAEFQFHRDFSYTYLPILHGPLLLYLQGIVFFLFGASDYTMRLIPALAGIGGFLLIAQMRHLLGLYGRFVALLFYTFSAPLMFYQRFMRNDPLLIFLTLWALLALMNMVKYKSRRSIVQFLLAVTLMICTKESSIFFYFTLITFALLVFLHDCIHWPLFKRSLSPSQLTPNKILRLSLTILSLFGIIVLLQTQMIEGITYDAEVVEELGRNTSLATMNSLSGLQQGEGKWVLYYLYLFACCSAAISTLYYFHERQAGANARISKALNFLARNQFLILGTVAACFILYWALFTTLFLYPENPFNIYRRTLGYWMGQNAIHRIEGPFHYHFINLIIYELPLVLLAVGVLIASLWDNIPKAPLGAPTCLLVVFFLIMSAVCFFLPNIFSWLFLIPILICAAFLLLNLFGKTPIWLVRFFLFGLAFYFIFYLLSPGWNAIYNFPVESNDPRVVNYRDYLDETISVTNSYHLLLIILPTIAVLYHVWGCLNRQRRFEAFAFWWMLTTFGATSYAREKVPWVGIHTILPLLLIAGIYAQRIFTSQRQFVKSAGLFALGIALLLGIKNSAQLNVRYSSDVRERMVYGHSTRDLKNHVLLIQKMADISLPKFSHPLYQEFPTTLEKDWVMQYNNTSANRMAKIYVGHEELNWPLYWYLRDLEMTTFETPELAIQKGIPYLFLTPKQAAELPNLEETYFVMRGRSRMHWTPRAANEEALWGIWRLGIPGYKRTPDTRTGELVTATKNEWLGLWNYWWARKVMEQPTPNFSVVEYIFAVNRNALSYQRSLEGTFEQQWNQNQGASWEQNQDDASQWNSDARNAEGRRITEEILDSLEPEESEQTAPQKGGRFMDFDAIDEPRKKDESTPFNQ